MPNALAKVLIYDTRTLQCELLAESLKRSMNDVTVESLGGPASLTQKIPAGEPCVVLFADVYHRHHEGTIKFMAQLKTQFPAVPFIVCVQAGHTERMVEAFRMGAAGVIYSNESLSQLTKCIECVARGEIWVKRSELHHVLQALPKTDARITDSNGRRLLTSREEQVACLIVQGLSNREISSSLRIAESTVKNYVFHTFEKLGVSNRVELARYVTQHADPGTVSTERAEILRDSKGEKALPKPSSTSTRRFHLRTLDSKPPRYAKREVSGASARGSKK